MYFIYSNIDFWVLVFLGPRPSALTPRPLAPKNRILKNIPMSFMKYHVAIIRHNKVRFLSM